MIKAERRRQITKEKWTAKHDDSHDGGTLSGAARCYERCATYQEECGQFPPALTAAFSIQPKHWFWEPHLFKIGRTAIRTLVKAGALFQADVDRITRARKRADHRFLVRKLEEARKAVERVAAKIDRLLK